jgi:hypothetical protein
MIQRILNPFKALRTLKKTSRLLRLALQDYSQAEALAIQDGPDGWNLLFIACHLHDYESHLRQRVEAILREDDPVFEPWDQLDLAERHAYADQKLQEVLAKLQAQRNELIELLSTLDDAAWLRTGMNPSQGPGSLLDVVINAGLHDIDHLEQIANCYRVQS